MEEKLRTLKEMGIYTINKEYYTEISIDDESKIMVNEYKNTPELNKIFNNFSIKNKGLYSINLFKENLMTLSVDEKGNIKTKEYKYEEV